MIGFIVVNPEVLIARELERGGRAAPGLDFIRWRLADLSAEIRDDAEFWGIHRHDVARSRAEQLAAARGGNAAGGRSVHAALVEIIDLRERIGANGARVSGS